MKLRHAIPDDAMAVAKVHVNSWRSAYRSLVPDDRLAKLDHTRVAESFRKSISLGSEDIYIVEEIDTVIGFLALGRCRDSDVDQGVTGEIYAMYLVPEQWRKGIGQSMWREGERIFKSRGYSQVVLWVFEVNEQGRRFYEAMGFATDGASRVLNIGAPLDAIRYTKDIG
jgi:ribosomal protein S18 acetylase RimI-like enzyme